jgi:hypothetical protein
VYAKARIKFCEQVAYYVTNAETTSILTSLGVFELMCPLVCDPHMTVRMNAINCLSRMANFSMEVADWLIAKNVHHALLQGLIDEKNNSVNF